MLLTEYDYDTDIAVQRKEAFDDGIQQGISQGLQQGIAQGLSQGELQAKIETARNFLAMGLSPEQIAQGTGLSKETIEQIRNNKI